MSSMNDTNTVKWMLKHIVFESRFLAHPQSLSFTKNIFFKKKKNDADAKIKQCHIYIYMVPVNIGMCKLKYEPIIRQITQYWSSVILKTLVVQNSMCINFPIHWQEFIRPMITNWWPQLKTKVILLTFKWRNLALKTDAVSWQFFCLVQFARRQEKVDNFWLKQLNTGTINTVPVFFDK